MTNIFSRIASITCLLMPLIAYCADKPAPAAASKVGKNMEGKPAISDQPVRAVRAGGVAAIKDDDILAGGSGSAGTTKNGRVPLLKFNAKKE